MTRAPRHCMPICTGCRHCSFMSAITKCCAAMQPAWPKKPRRPACRFSLRSGIRCGTCGTPGPIELPEARAAITQIGEFVRQHLDQRSSYFILIVEVLHIRPRSAGSSAEKNLRSKQPKKIVNRPAHNQHLNLRLRALARAVPAGPQPCQSAATLRRPRHPGLRAQPGRRNPERERTKHYHHCHALADAAVSGSAAGRVLDRRTAPAAARNSAIARTAGPLVEPRAAANRSAGLPIRRRDHACRDARFWALQAYRRPRAAGIRAAAARSRPGAALPPHHPAAADARPAAGRDPVLHAWPGPANRSIRLAAAIMGAAGSRLRSGAARHRDRRLRRLRRGRNTARRHHALVRRPRC